MITRLASEGKTKLSDDFKLWEEAMKSSDMCRPPDSIGPYAFATDPARPPIKVDIKAVLSWWDDEIFERLGTVTVDVFRWIFENEGFGILVLPVAPEED